MARVRLEFMDDQITTVGLSEPVRTETTLEPAAGGQAFSDPAPAFPSGTGFVRMTVLDGAVRLAWGAQAELPSPRGVLVEAGDEPVTAPIDVGQRVLAMDAADLASRRGRYALNSGWSAAIRGGIYVWSAVAPSWAAGPATLKALGPDGVTELDVVQLTANGVREIKVGDGARLRVATSVPGLTTSLAETD